MESSIYLDSRSKFEQNILVRQQVTNAYNEFVNMFRSLLKDINDDDNVNNIKSSLIKDSENSSNDNIRVILFKDGVPISIVKLDMELGILGTKSGIFRSVVYYDSLTLTYRIRGSIYSVFDFSFQNPILEKNRQILEISHALLILNYSNGSQSLIKNLVKKFNFLTANNTTDDAINENDNNLVESEIPLALSDIIDNSDEKEKVE